MEEKIFKCENCGSSMEFDVKPQNLKCPNCDKIIEIIDDKSTIVEHTLTLEDRETIKTSVKTSSTMECKGCGAHVEVEADCTAVECPYCGSSYVLAEKQEEVLVPDGVIPFKIEKVEVSKMIKKWISGRWLAPNKLKTLYQNDKVQGLYVPYWTFDSMVDCPYTAMGGRDRQVAYEDDEGKTKYKTETDWYFTQGRINHFFDDVQVNASKNMKDSLIRGIEPFNTKNVSTYSPNYLSGFSSETYSIGLEEGNIEAKNRMRNSLYPMAEEEVRRHYDKVKDVNLKPYFYGETYKHVLLPVYATSYGYNSKNYTVLINGETGRMKGDYPKSPVKIALLVILALIIAAMGAYFYNSNEENTGSYDNKICVAQQFDDKNTINYVYKGIEEVSSQEVYIHGVVFKSVF